MDKDLRFECQRSGHCCIDPSIIVTLTTTDIFHLYQEFSFNFDLLLKKIDFINVTDPNLKERMVFPSFKTIQGEVIIAAHKLENGECTFYNPIKKKCNIYEYRPVVCRSYPFVFSDKNGSILVMISPNARSSCKGLGKGKSVNFPGIVSLGRKIMKQIAETSFIAENVNIEANNDKPLTLRETLLVILNYMSRK
ncbi:MAG: YkgJ family cysteine cluster protein [Candidatus Hodarchaeales archaeon]